MSKICQSVYDLVKPIAEEFGLFLVEVTYEKKFNGMNLTLVIDKDGGVTLDDCETLHRAVDQPLEDLNPTNDSAYILNVSSPGLDRNLTLPWDFQRNMNKRITVKLYAPENGKKSFSGVLVEYDEPYFVIEDGANRLKFDRTKTANIAPVIEF